MKKMIFSLLILLASISLEAREYTVSLTGNADFSTIQDAIDKARAGDTISIKAGTYRERLFFNHSGKKSQHIVVKNYKKDRVIIDGRGIKWSVNWGGLLDFSEVSYITLSGLEVRNSTHAGIFLDDCHHINIKNSKTHNTYSSGIGVWYSNNVHVTSNEVSLACNDGGEECISIVHSHHVDVKYNKIHDNGPGTKGGEGIDIKQGSHDVLVAHNEVYDLNNRIGIYADAWDTYTYNIIFDGNSVHGCTDTGMGIASERGRPIEHVTFMNNIIYNNTDGGIAIGGWTGVGKPVPSHPIRHIKIINNTIYNNKSNGLYIGNPDVIDIKVYNNIFSKNTDSQIYIDNSPIDEIHMNSNLIEGVNEEYPDVNKIVANPLFVDAKNGDFHLLFASPAIDSGKSNNIVLHDYDNNLRPKNKKWDIGAYENTLNSAFLIPILFILL